MSQSIALPLVTVEIKRNLENVITRDVFEHEVPILRLLHGGAENFRVTDSDAGEKAISADAHAELARLQNAFDSKNAAVVHRVYPDAEVLAAKLGVPLTPIEDGALPVMADVTLRHKTRRADKVPEASDSLLDARKAKAGK